MENTVDTAVRAAREGGEILMTHFRRPETNNVRHKSGNEPVSDADIASNEAIIRHLRGAFPDYRILSEESDEKTLTDDPTWVIDPLDGTKNYIFGMPLFGVMIALCVGREPVLGVLYDPLLDEMYVTRKGEGATMNGEAIRVSEREPDAPGILFAGKGKADKDGRHAAILFKLEQTTPYFRRFGSAFTMMAAVACGRADAVILTGQNKPWDVLAGVLLIREAGGTVTDYCGREWREASQDLVATNGNLHELIIGTTRTIEETGCV